MYYLQPTENYAQHFYIFFSPCLDMINSFILMHSVLNYVCVKFWQLAFLFNSQLFISFCISFISLQASFLPSCFLSFANICVFSLRCLLSLEWCIKFLSRRSLVFNSGFFPESVTFLHTFLKTHQTSIHNKHTASL